MRLEIETPSPNSIEIIAACSQLNSPAASICSVANLFTQLNCYCDPTECKTRLYETIPNANNAIQAPAMPHQLCNRTSYANNARAPAAMQSTSSKLPANEPLPSRNAHQNALTQTRNLSKFRPNFSLNFRHKPTWISYLNHSTSRANKQTYTHEMLCNLLNCSGHESLYLINF